MPHGWFEIPGVQTGARTLADQMRGLEQALAGAKGKRVLDLGCAEGLIGREFRRSGACEVVGIECNPEVAAAGAQQCGEDVRIVVGNLGYMELPRGPWDIVLALAILHKLKEPARTVQQIAALKPGLVVVRLPAGSTGYFETKSFSVACDLNAEMKRRGFSLECVVSGPQGELVQYWRPC